MPCLYTHMLQILWLNDPHTNVTVSWSLSKQNYYFPPINIGLAFMRTCGKVLGWDAKDREGSWKSVEFLDKTIVVSKALNWVSFSTFLEAQERGDQLGRAGCLWGGTGLPCTGCGPQKMLCPFLWSFTLLPAASLLSYPHGWFPFF